MTNEENKDLLSPWGNGVDDKSFLKQVWNCEIDSLKELEVKAEEKLKLCIWKNDKRNLEWKLKCIKQIIISKIENPEFIPKKYK